MTTLPFHCPRFSFSPLSNTASSFAGSPMSAAAPAGMDSIVNVAVTASTNAILARFNMDITFICGELSTDCAPLLLFGRCCKSHGTFGIRQLAKFHDGRIETFEVAVVLCQQAAE